MRAIPGALLRAGVGAVVGCVLFGLVALVGLGFAEDAYAGRERSAVRMGFLGGAVILAVPGALAIVQMYSDRERWSPIARTVALLPGAAIGALGGVAALILGWSISWLLQLAGAQGPTEPWFQIVLGGTVIGAALGITGLGRRRRKEAEVDVRRRRR